MRAHRTFLTVIGTLGVLATAGGLVGASASGFPVLNASLYSTDDHAAEPGPAKVTCDSFAGNTNMNGRAVATTAACGSYTWTVHTGAWDTRSSETRPSGARATVTVAAGGSDRTVEVTFTRAGAAGDVTGIALAHNGSSATPRYLAVVVVGTNSLQIRTVNGTTETTVSSTSVTVPASGTLRATLRSGVVRAWLNNTLRVTYTLTSGQLSLISGGTRAGLYDHNASARHSDVIISQAWPV